ncbi:MAG TPA: hypothetical protein VGO47_08105, partial [Chlamydiales bacterium]|nr:hypothetical protein [Chlamydiales bacterium]
SQMSTNVPRYWTLYLLKRKICRRPLPLMTTPPRRRPTISHGETSPRKVHLAVVTKEFPSGSNLVKVCPFTDIQYSEMFTDLVLEK